MRRKKIRNVRRDKRVFTASAYNTNGRNFNANPMRGGYRL